MPDRPLTRGDVLEAVEVGRIRVGDLVLQGTHLVEIKKVPTNESHPGLFLRWKMTTKTWQEQLMERAVEAGVADPEAVVNEIWERHGGEMVGALTLSTMLSEVDAAAQA